MAGDCDACAVSGISGDRKYEAYLVSGTLGNYVKTGIEPYWSRGTVPGTGAGAYDREIGE